MASDSLESGLGFAKDRLERDKLKLEEELNNIPKVEELLKQLEEIKLELSKIEKEEGKSEKRLKDINQLTALYTITVLGVMMPLYSFLKLVSEKTGAPIPEAISDEVYNVSIIMARVAAYISAFSVLILLVKQSQKQSKNDALHKE